MNNLGARVTDVNQVAEQLLSSDNCNKDQIHQTRDQLNNRSEQTCKSYWKPLKSICAQEEVLVALIAKYFF